MFNSYLAFCRTDKAKGLLRALNNRWKDEERDQAMKQKPGAPTDEHHIGVTLYTAQSTTHHSTFKLEDGWLIDSGSDTNLINDWTKAEFRAERLGRPDEKIKSGSTTFPVVAIGKAKLVIGKVTFILHDTVYCPGFHTSIISHSQLRKFGVWWHGGENSLYRYYSDKPPQKIIQLIMPNDNLPYLDIQTPPTDSSYPIHQWPVNSEGNALPTPEDRNVYFTKLFTSEESGGQPAATAATSKTGGHQASTAATNKTGGNPALSRTVQPVRKATSHRWHEILGHIGKERIKNIMANCEGVEVLDPSTQALTTNQCPTCALAKSHQHHSRISRITLDTTPFGHMSMDLMEFIPGYNGDKWLFHFYDLSTHLHFVETTPYKSQEYVLLALQKLLAVVSSINRKILKFGSDQDPSMVTNLQLCS